MSKISLTPNASGTGTFTIASPDSNTNRTLTLPDADGALLTANGDGSALTGIDTSPPTAYGAVGTYVTAVVTNNNVAVLGGSTYSGSSLLLHRRSGTYLNSMPLSEFPNLGETSSMGLSGTWRLMSGEVRVNFSDTSTYGVAALFVRVS